jgi:FkbH-like protein
MNSLYSRLEWLRPPPPELRAQIKAVASSTVDLGRQLQSLATYSLDLNQLTLLAQAIKKLEAAGNSLHPLVPFKLAILSNSTIDLIVPALVASAARHGIALQVIQPAFDQVAQEALAPNSNVNASKPDAVLIALDYHALPVKISLEDSAATAVTVKGVMEHLQILRSGIKQNSNAMCILQTFPHSVETLFGSLDRSLRGTVKNLIDTINRELASSISGTGDALLDVAGLAELVGLANWHNPRLWNMAKLPFSEELIPIYADHVARTLAAIRGKSKKVLIFDLDNTIWGGVIGDDSLEGIKIARGDPAGEAYLSVQRYILDLRQRGVVLAVSSKNTDEIARAPFLQHPEMLIKLDHIAVFQANWDDKAANIRAIAKELSLGLDAVVFLDDNPVERGLVRSLLPQVAVPELPDDPDYYARTLSAAGYFEAAAFAAEDLRRADFYQDNARRAELQKQAGGIDAYLSSLEMTITFQPFDSVGRSRIVQLINKTNQFNLRTRRYTEPEVTAAENDPEIFTLQVRLSDIYGDNGMISVVICRPSQAGIWDIDTWLMSCRVLGRKVENMVLREILRHARAAGIRTLAGTYKPTDANAMVADHYAKLGFAKVGQENSGQTYWELQIDKEPDIDAPMKVISRGFSYADKLPS